VHCSRDLLQVHGLNAYVPCQATSLVVELDSKLGEANAVQMQLSQASSAISQLQSQLQAERSRTAEVEKDRDAAIKDVRETSFALKDEMAKSMALSNQLQELQRGIDNAQYAVQETTQQLQAARNEAHHLQSALAQTQVRSVPSHHQVA
jgi:chromosome segregation ATPase